LLEFRKMTLQDQAMVMQWRKREDVTRYMVTDLPAAHGLAEQEAWFKKNVEAADPFHHWLIVKDGQDVGVIQLENYDPGAKSTSYGYYIGVPEARAAGGFIPPHLYNWLFFDSGLEIEKVTAQVAAANERVLKLHRLQGLKNTGLIKDGLKKAGQSWDLVKLELTREQWQAQQGRWKRCRSPFPR